MTTIDEAREAVYERWVADWDDTTPFVFENNKGSEPATKIPWCRVSVRNLSANQETLGQIGNRIYLRQARVFVQVMAPTDTGMKEGADLAQQARDIFEGKRIGDIVFYDGVVRETAPDGDWYVTLVEVAFEYREEK